MSDSESLPSDIEEEALKAISGLLPEKYKSKYEMAYAKYEKWCTEKEIRNLANEKEPKLSKAKLKLIQKAAEEAKRQKEDAIKQEEEAETARESQKEEEKVKQEEAVEQKEDDGKINLELKKKQEEEQLCKKQEEGAQRELSEQNLKFGEEEEKKVEIVKEQKQKVIEIETKSFQLEQKTQKGLDERRQKEIEEQAILEAEETHRKQDEVLKRKKEEGEGQTPPKKKKEDKTPPRKLEVTTRRQKAQLQKAAEEAEKAAAEAEKTGAENKKTEAKRSVGNPKNLSPKKVAALEPTTSADSSCSDTATILLDIKEEREEEENKLEVEKDSPKEKGKKTPEQKGKGKNTLDKVKKALEKAKLEEEKKAEEEEERKVEEQKKADEQRKAEQERKADEEKRKAEEEKKAAEEERKAAEEKKALEEKKAALEEKKAAEEKKALEEKKAAEEKALDEKKAAEKKALDERNAALKKLLEENKDDTKTESKKSEEAPGDKKSEASAEDDEESEDSEVERQRELIKQKKQEAIKKCRAKRMEKLAKAAEMKRKRQEQAAQQRAARMAAEEAERIAAEKARVNRRYGRYGNPKPQISLIDEPVRETAGTIKSPMGLFNPQTEQIMIRQPIVIDDDSNFAEKPLKQLDVTLSSSSYKLLAPPTSEPMAVDSTEETPTKHRRPIGSEDIMMVDEETRMSADFRGSRAQTPAKQPIAPPETMIEDSQGSNGTESVGGKSKSSKAPKMEVFQDLESIQVTAEQLAEYSWNGRGPFMIQEQVSLFLGIKSFKRKYPNCQRRTVDMQERDYLKENGFVTEAQCDLGLTAVNAQDILDIMYADFQDKYEEYCKVQREKQDRELANKQKALSQFTFKPGYEKLDIIEQAVQSAAAWNQQFNKTRREERKAHMDLQNLTVHYPKTKVKVIPTQKIGDHPIALVPGQFTDYYKAFTPTELNNLPLNTMCYDEIKVPGKDSDSDDSSSGSDSDSDSSSDSSCSSSSCDEDCKECVKHGNAEVNGNVGNDVTMDNNGSNDSVVLVSVTTPA